MPAKKFSASDVTEWFKSNGARIYLGDVLDETNSAHMGVGFARYKRGESNAWTVTYDEILVITKGTFSVKTDDGVVTARAGEIIQLTKGTKLTYAADDDAELVYVSYPHWAAAQKASPHAALLDTFGPVDTAEALG